MLEARFGRGTRKGKTCGVPFNTSPSFVGSEDCSRPNVSATPYSAAAACKTSPMTSSSAAFAAMALSCGAIERVRRNLLLAGSKKGAGLSGLRYSLAAASGSGDGRLTKV